MRRGTLLGCNGLYTGTEDKMYLELNERYDLFFDEWFERTILVM